MDDIKKPKAQSSFAEKELDKAQAQFDAFDQNVKSLTQDRLNAAPKEDVEPQTKLSQSEISDSKDIYLKPTHTIGSREQFNEKFRDKYEFAKEYVYFIAENKEIIGESIIMWTKPYPGVPAQEWTIPVNTPVWAPRFVAEQLKRKYYSRLVMKQKTVQTDNVGEWYGAMAVDTRVPRLDAFPATKNRSIFMGNTNFKTA